VAQGNPQPKIVVISKPNLLVESTHPFTLLRGQYTGRIAESHHMTVENGPCVISRAIVDKNDFPVAVSLRIYAL
jgi:hypothetical protein